MCKDVKETQHTHKKTLREHKHTQKIPCKINKLARSPAHKHIHTHTHTQKQKQNTKMKRTPETDERKGSSEASSRRESVGEEDDDAITGMVVDGKSGGNMT